MRDFVRHNATLHTLNIRRRTSVEIEIIAVEAKHFQISSAEAYYMSVMLRPYFDPCPEVDKPIFRWRSHNHV